MWICSVEFAGTYDEPFVHGGSESAEKVTPPGSQVIVTVVTFEFGSVIRCRFPAVP